MPAARAACAHSAAAMPGAAAAAVPDDGAGSLVGRHVSKIFGRKRFAGKVTAFCAEVGWYSVEYEDGCAAARTRGGVVRMPTTFCVRWAE